MKDEREQIDQDEAARAERKQKLKAVFETQRETVRQMMTDRDNLHAEDLKAALTHKPKAATASKPKAKPMWAMSAIEKDDFEEDEANDLISFAENLDYDRYVGDLEFRQNLQALQDRAGKISKMQEGFKDQLLADLNAEGDDEERSTSAGSPRSSRLEGVEGQSVLGDIDGEVRARKRRTEGKEGERWDSSTACGEERPVVDEQVKTLVEHVMESAPAIKGVHSKESLARVIAQTKERQLSACNGGGPDALVEEMRRHPPAAAPVIIASSDTQHRMHKPVDPSQLPYLYRSPAV